MLVWWKKITFNAKFSAEKKCQVVSAHAPFHTSDVTREWYTIRNLMHHNPISFNMELNHRSGRKIKRYFDWHNIHENMDHKRCNVSLNDPNDHNEFVYKSLLLYPLATRKEHNSVRSTFKRIWCWTNRPFSSSAQPPFQSEDKFLLWKSVFIHIEIGTNYLNKNFALRLALKERLRGTRPEMAYSSKS